MKSLSLKISLFTFLSAIVCLIGYNFLFIDLFMLIRDILFLCAYTSFFAWVCERVYPKVRFGINVTVSIISLALAIYFGINMSLTSNELLLTCYVYAFYIVTIVCMIGCVVLFGRMIFTPKQENESAKLDDASENQISNQDN